MYLFINKNLFLVAMIVMTTFFTNCKKPNKNSSTKTIDNFTNTNESSFKLNYCTPRNKSFYTSDSIYGNSFAVQEHHAESFIDATHFVEDQPGILNLVRNDIKEVLLATPIFISQSFFYSGAKIYIKSSQPSVCNKFHGKGFAPVGVHKLFSCWLSDTQYNGIVLGEGETSKGKVSLRQSIRHDLLRAMTYYVFNKTLQHQGTSSNSALNALVDKIRIKGTQMTVALNQDLAKKGLKTIPLDADDAKNTEIKKLVMIEAIDSIYCSEDTHNTLRKNFPQFFASFYEN